MDKQDAWSILAFVLLIRFVSSCMSSCISDGKKALADAEREWEREKHEFDERIRESDERILHAHDDIIRFLNERPDYKFLPKNEMELRYYRQYQRRKENGLE